MCEVSYVCFKDKRRFKDKKKIEGHIYKYHVPLDRCPYYCSLCLFRSSEEEVFMRHIDKYKLHEELMKTKKISHSNCLYKSDDPYYIVEGRDFEILPSDQMEWIDGDTCSSAELRREQRRSSEKRENRNGKDVKADIYKGKNKKQDNHKSYEYEDEEEDDDGEEKRGWQRERKLSKAEMSLNTEDGWSNRPKVVMPNAKRSGTKMIEENRSRASKPDRSRDPRRRNSRPWCRQIRGPQSHFQSDRRQQKADKYPEFHEETKTSMHRRN